MKLSSGKWQFWEWKGLCWVGAGTSFPSPMLVFYIHLCRKTFIAWKNVKCQHGMGEGQNVPAPTVAFLFPELQLSRGELHFD
jgi:hypothetical protein